MGGSGDGHFEQQMPKPKLVKGREGKGRKGYSSGLSLREKGPASC